MTGKEQASAGTPGEEAQAVTRASLVERARAAIEAATGGTFDGEVLDRPEGSIAVRLVLDAQDELWLDEIETLTPGKHLADGVLAALRDFVVLAGAMLYVPVTNEGYWRGRFQWLSAAPFDLHGDLVLCFDGASAQMGAADARAPAHVSAPPD